jgi:hypothetical protein
MANGITAPSKPDRAKSTNHWEGGRDQEYGDRGDMATAGCSAEVVGVMD